MDKKIKNKVDYFKNIIAVAHADGVLDPIEKDFLLEKAQELGIPIENIEDLMKEVEKISLVVPVIGYPREEQLADAIFTAVIDGDIHEKEKQICIEIGKALGFDEDYINSLILKSLKLWSDR